MLGHRGLAWIMQNQFGSRKFTDEEYLLFRIAIYPELYPSMSQHMIETLKGKLHLIPCSLLILNELLQIACTQLHETPLWRERCVGAVWEDMGEESQAKAKWNTDFHNPIIMGFIAGFLSMVGDKLGVMEYSPTGSQIPEQVFTVMSYFTADPLTCESILPERATSESWRDLRSLSECLTNLIPTYDESTNRFLPFGVKRMENCDAETMTAMKVEAAGGNSGVEEDRPTTDDHGGCTSRRL